MSHFSLASFRLMFLSDLLNVWVHGFSLFFFSTRSSFPFLEFILLFRLAFFFSLPASLSSPFGVCGPCVLFPRRYLTVHLGSASLSWTSTSASSDMPLKPSTNCHVEVSDFFSCRISLWVSFHFSLLPVSPGHTLIPHFLQFIFYEFLVCQVAIFKLFCSKYSLDFHRLSNFCAGFSLLCMCVIIANVIPPILLPGLCVDSCYCERL